MKNLKYFIAAALAAPLMWACYSDSAENPTFGDGDVPRIYRDWLPNLVFNVGDTLVLDHPVSPADGATFSWKLNGVEISNQRALSYILEDFGNFELRFEVVRKGVTNFRTAALTVAKPFEPKPYNKISLGFLTVDGTIADVPWSDITHLVVSSSFVNASGPLIVQTPPAETPHPTMLTTDLGALITTAHNNGVYVLMEYSGQISRINGAAVYGQFDFYNAAAGSTRANVIASMLEFVAANGFDGINVYMDKAHDSGVFTNPDALKAFYDDLATAAPTTTDRGRFYLTMSLYIGWTNAAFTPVVHNERYDWYNIMAFAAEDLAPGPHSAAWIIPDAVAMWTGQGVPKEKLMPVAPAFGLRYFGDPAGYTWGNLWEFTQYIPYRTLCADYPNAPTTNTQTPPGSGENGIWYDGLADVQAKAELVVSEGLAGLGLWSVENDARESEKSLMHRINTSLGNN